MSKDKNKLDVGNVHNYLSIESYWAKNIPLTVVQKSVAGSFCFGIYKTEAESGKLNNQKSASVDQVGFAKVVTDYATFGI